MDDRQRTGVDSSNASESSITKDITPVFLLSMPRSGSTLVQRVLATRQEVSTTAEPWVLLAHLGVFRNEGQCADFDYPTMVSAIREFTGELPGGLNRYEEALRRFAHDIYSAAASEGSMYFLDKTPRYSLIAEQIHRVFPDARFIYLWRNPLSIIASSIETWGRPGQWNIHRICVDLFKGLPTLISVAQRRRDCVYTCRFEDLATDIEAWRGMFDYLDLTWDDASFESFCGVEFNGGMGDQVGRQQYSYLTTEPIDKWTTVINNPLRKWWCKRYLKWLGQERLEIMGYSQSELLAAIDAVPLIGKRTLADAVAMTYGWLYSSFELPLLRKKWLAWFGRKKYTAHR